MVPRASPSVPSTRQRMPMSPAQPSRAGPVHTSSQELARQPLSYSRMYRLMPSVWGKRVRRIGPRAGEDAVGCAEPVAERVEMMDAHHERRERGQSLAPRHPVRDGSHVDGAEYGFAEPAALQHVLERAHRLVVAHVLVDGQGDAGRGDTLRRTAAPRARSGPAASARGCRECGRLRRQAAWMMAGCASGGTAMSSTSIVGSSSNCSIVA